MAVKYITFGSRQQKLVDNPARNLRKFMVTYEEFPRAIEFRCFADVVMADELLNLSIRRYVWVVLRL